MNETLSNIRQRRSCRAFKNEPVSEADLSAIIDAGIWAPTGMNKQDRHFTVIRNKTMFDRMNKTAREHVQEPVRSRLVERNNGNPDISIHYYAPLLIILSGGETSCAIAAENICLAAQSLGLGSCMLGMISILFENDKNLAADLKIPDGMEPRLGIAVGYASKQMPAGERDILKVTYI
ncbi:MAG: nitroreductase [Treponema sp.]|nr:nitroreductase [Treponema sp.]